MRQARAIWLKLNVREADVRLNKAGKAHDKQLQLDIGESRGNGQHKVQEEYEALAQGNGRTKKGLPQCKGGISAWEKNAK